MNRDKQIFEMARYITEGARQAVEDAEALYNAGYRKADEVVCESVKELERYLRLNEDIAIKCKEENGEHNREYWKGKLSAFKQIRGFIDAELKKKYTESEKD